MANNLLFLLVIFVAEGRVGGWGAVFNAMFGQMCVFNFQRLKRVRGDLGRKTD